MEALRPNESPCEKVAMSLRRDRASALSNSYLEFKGNLMTAFMGNLTRWGALLSLLTFAAIAFAPSTMAVAQEEAPAGEETPAEETPAPTEEPAPEEAAEEPATVESNAASIGDNIKPRKG